MTLARLVLAAALAGVALTVAAPAGATNECRGLNPCVAVAGPWVVVPAALRAKAQFQLTCPRGFVVGGTDAELSHRAIDVSFAGASGAPVSPGITTSRTILFVATYTGAGSPTPSFRPHIGCIPATGGGRRTPTAARTVFPPGMPTERRVVTSRVPGTKRVVASCRADERLVDWYASRGFGTPDPPTPALVRGLAVTARATARAAVAIARAQHSQGLVQVAAICAGGR
jgi:hypothetical protein